MSRKQNLTNSSGSDNPPLTSQTVENIFHYSSGKLFQLTDNVPLAWFLTLLYSPVALNYHLFVIISLARVHSFTARKSVPLTLQALHSTHVHIFKRLQWFIADYEDYWSLWNRAVSLLIANMIHHIRCCGMMSLYVSTIQLTFQFISVFPMIFPHMCFLLVSILQSMQVLTAPLKLY